MVDEMKAFNQLSEMVIEIRELRVAVSKKDGIIRDLERKIEYWKQEVDELKTQLENSKPKNKSEET